MKHIIKKQILSLQIDRTLDAFRMQQQVSAHYWKEIVPLLQKVFDSISNEDEIISVDRLEIDLGYVSEKSIVKNEWTAELQPTLKKKIEESFFTNTAIPVVTRRKKILNSCEQWLFYITKGYLPWNRLHADTAWFAQVLDALATDFNSIAKLRELILASQTVRKRIVEQHDIPILITLTEILTAEKQSGLTQLLKELFIISNAKGYSRDASLSNKNEFEKRSWSEILMLAAGDNSASSLPLEALRLFIGRFSLDIHSIEPLLVNLPMVSGFVNSGKDLSPIKEQEITVQSTHKTGNDQDDGDLFISNAGLVLLHPFLSTFFTRISLLKDGDFSDTGSRQKAIYLLHFLATGNKKAEEYELVIPKMICAWAFDEPVEKDVFIENECYEEADQMLIATIQQWDILNGTSVTGLRESFLQRKGKLQFKNGNYNLVIETSSIDLLLDHLPWNISMIKLPWMNELLRVEWR